MIKEKYLNQIKEKVINFAKDKDAKFFIYGSSLGNGHFGDIDLGVIGNTEMLDIRELKDSFEESNLPYFVDTVDFNKVSESFKNNVFNGKTLWIKQ